jgi:hypothetical protein
MMCILLLFVKQCLKNFGGNFYIKFQYGGEIWEFNKSFSLITFNFHDEQNVFHLD